MNHLFVYGSLMFAPVWEALLGRQHRSIAATLSGYQRRCVRGETYPGIIPHPDSQVSGRLMLELNAEELARLDDFEGDEYSRIVVEVMDNSGVLHSAWVYLYKAEYQQRLDDKPWSPEVFERKHLATFVR